MNNNMCATVIIIIVDSSGTPLHNSGNVGYRKEEKMEQCNVLLCSKCKKREGERGGELTKLFCRFSYSSLCLYTTFSSHNKKIK